MVCDSPQNAAKQADVVITMLPAAKHVKEVYLGENGVLEVLKQVAYALIAAPLTHKPLKTLLLLHRVKILKFVMHQFLVEPLVQEP